MQAHWRRRPTITTETDNNDEFAGRVLALLALLLVKAKGKDTPALDKFFAGWAALGALIERDTSKPRPSERASKLLIEAARRCRLTSQSSTFPQHGDPDMTQLETMGLVRFAAIDAGETYDYIHPFAQMLI